MNPIADKAIGRTPRDYIAAIVNRETAWMEEFAVPKSPGDPLYVSHAQSSPDAHIALLQKLLKATPFLIPQDPGMIASTLWHSDIHASNIFVSKGRISSLIDWQAAWMGPFFLQARQPPLLEHKGEILLELPPNFKDLDIDERTRLNEQVSASILLHVYDTHTATQNPLLSKLYRLPYGATRTQPMIFAGNTWEDDILPLRESLIRLERWVQFEYVQSPLLYLARKFLLCPAGFGRNWVSTRLVPFISPARICNPTLTTGKAGTKLKIFGTLWQDLWTAMAGQLMITTQKQSDTFRIFDRTD